MTVPDRSNGFLKIGRHAQRLFPTWEVFPIFKIQKNSHPQRSRSGPPVTQKDERTTAERNELKRGFQKDIVVRDHHPHVGRTYSRPNLINCLLSSIDYGWNLRTLQYARSTTAMDENCDKMKQMGGLVGSNSLWKRAVQVCEVRSCRFVLRAATHRHSVRSHCLHVMCMMNDSSNVTCTCPGSVISCRRIAENLSVHL